jgi:poly(3-hydroxybutyrate) depolymerase
VIAFTGGTIQGLGSGRAMSSYPGAETTVATWATYDKCDPTPAKVDEHVDVDADMGSGGQAAESTVTRWASCQPGGASELWTIPGGGHGPNLSEAFPGAVLDFLEAHPKP